MLIGVNFTRNTYIHGVEEWEHVPGTLTEGTQDLYVVDYEGKRHHTPQHRHCAPRSSRDVLKVEPVAIRDGATTVGTFETQNFPLRRTPAPRHGSAYFFH